MSDTEKHEDVPSQKCNESKASNSHTSSNKNKNRSEKFSMRFLIQSRNAGAVIGLRGENIHRLEKECDAQITIPEGKSPERILVITSRNQSLGSCMYKVIEWLKDYRGHNSPVEIKPLIHESQVESFTSEFVGKINSNSNCEVKVATINCPHSTERVVSLKGTVDQISLAIPIFHSHLLNNPVKGPERTYSPQVHQTVDAEEYLGWDYKEGFGHNRVPKSHKEDVEVRKPKKRRREDEYSYTVMKIAIPFDLSNAAFGNDGKRLARMRKESGADVIVTDSTIREEVIATISGSDSEIKHARRILEDHVWYYS